MRKCSVDLVTGFLSSGKTSFINLFMAKTLGREEVILIQCEDGKADINANVGNKLNLNIKKFSSNKDLTEERLIRMIKFYKPSRMVIECNGIEDVTELIKLFNTTRLKAYFKITGLITILDTLTFGMFIKNLGHIFIPAVESSDLIILNKADMASDEVIEKNLNIIKNLNTHGHIVVAYDKSDFEKKVNKTRVISA
ncbi:MAG: GTP-binding protein [Sarcina sp.]